LSNLDNLPIESFLELSHDEKIELIICIRERRRIQKTRKTKAVSEMIVLDLEGATAAGAKKKRSTKTKHSLSPEELIATLSEQQLLELMQALES
jgi:hypothetical protein